MIGYDGSDPKPGLTIQMVPVSSFLCPCRVRAKDGVQRLRVRNLAGVSRSTAGLIVPRVVCGRGQDPAPGVPDLSTGPPARLGVDFSASSQNAWKARENTQCRGFQNPGTRLPRSPTSSLSRLASATKMPGVSTTSNQTSIDQGRQVYPCRGSALSKRAFNNSQA